MENNTKSPQVLFICATPLEFYSLQNIVELLLKEVPIIKKDQRRYFEFSKGVVLLGHVGKTWASATAEFGIQKFKPDLVIDFGSAGALSSEFATGTILTPERVVDGDFGWQNGLVKELQVFNLKLSFPSEKSSLLCVDRLVFSDSERESLKERFLCSAVCGETYSVLAVSQFHKVPAISVRVVTDFSSDDLKQYAKIAIPLMESAAEKLLKENFNLSPK